MKKFLLSSGALLVVLLSVVGFNTLRFTSKQAPPAARAAAVLDEHALAERFAGALRFATISTQDSAQSDTTAFTGLQRYLQHIFPQAHAFLSREVINSYALLFKWQGADTSLKPILLASHLDVVPIEAATAAQWTHPPFAGVIAGGFIWGRGTLDDKAGVLGILEAVEALLVAGMQPQRTIYLAFGHDEEISGRKGAAQIAQLLQRRGVKLEYVLDEGGAIVSGVTPGLAAPVAFVGIAEKGYVSLELQVASAGGHSSMPPAQTAIGVLSSAIQRLESNPMPASLAGPTARMFEYLGPEMSFGMRAVFANLWLFQPLLERQLAAAPTTNAAIRTTTAATMFSAGVKENVLPSMARAVVNFRIRPGDSIAQVLMHTRATINDDRVQVQVLDRTAGGEPSSVSEIDTPSFQMLQRTIRQVFPETVVAPNLVLGATDARYYAPLSRNVYRFLPIMLAAEDLKRAHGLNERISVENYARIVDFYVHLIKNTAGG